VVEVREAEGLTIRSFRVVFRLERRIHKIDRWRIPVPYGIPLRGLAYWAVALLALIVLRRIPVVGELTGILPTPARLVVLPVGLAYLLTRVEIDGRPAHAVLASWARLKLSPACLAAFRAVPSPGTVVRLGDLTITPDERSARYRGAAISGPATVLLRCPPHGWMQGLRRRRLHVRQLPGPPLFVAKQVRLKAGQRMVVHG
jgi:TcpE family